MSDLYNFFFTDFELEVIPRNNNKQLWQLVLDNAAYVPVDYLNDTLDFQYVYETGLGIQLVDLSVIIKHDNQVCAVWPLSFKESNGIAQLKSFHAFVLPPLFVSKSSKKVKKSICKVCINLIESICRKSGIKTITSEEVFLNKTGISEWHYELVRKGAIARLKYELLINLSLDINDIKSLFRKSYKSLINSGLKTWQVGILKHGDEVIWQEFRDLHLYVSGRITRSEESWNMHFSVLEKGNAFLVYLRDIEGKMIGGGFFLTSSTEASYGVAAYDRSLFDKPIGHVVQFIAIGEMQRLNISWYKIGIRGFLTDIPKPSDKEISIAEFKEGFASDISSRFILDYTII